ncbi:hypothetical protein RSAG8_07677, partial [Rhizoctonia solani AG-8 WAC10335]
MRIVERDFVLGLKLSHISLTLLPNLLLGDCIQFVCHLVICCLYILRACSAHKVSVCVYQSEVFQEKGLAFLSAC